MICAVILSVTHEPAVGIAAGYGLDGQGVGVRVPAGTRVSFLHVVQTGSGTHLASYQMGNGGSFAEVKVARPRN
jgi:hypothetical protein